MKITEKAEIAGGESGESGSGATRYRFAVPLAETGIPARPGTRFRLSLLVNDNDGGKRLRLMEFSRGIENGKSPELFGYARLQ